MLRANLRGEIMLRSLLLRPRWPMAGLLEPARIGWLILKSDELVGSVKRKPGADGLHFFASLNARIPSGCTHAWAVLIDPLLFLFDGV